MRFLLYNIRYATGTGAAFHLPIPGAGYLRSDKRVLAGITRFIKGQDPDIVGLIEVDTGSIRTGKVNQADVIAASLGHYSIYQCKYGANSFNTFVPILNKQSNAFLAAPRVEGERFHYFDTGIKRLIIELELDDVCVFLVHLSLKFRHRHAQLRQVCEFVKRSVKPVIVTGDFNTFWGETPKWRCSWKRAGCAAPTSRACPRIPRASRAWNSTSSCIRRASRSTRSRSRKSRLRTTDRWSAISTSRVRPAWPMELR